MHLSKKSVLINSMSLLILGIIFSGNLFDDRLAILNSVITIPQIIFFFFTVTFIIYIKNYGFILNNSLSLKFYYIFILYLFINFFIVSIANKLPINIYALDKNLHVILIYPLLFLFFYTCDYNLFIPKLIFTIKTICLIFLFAAILKIFLNNGIPEGESGKRLSVFSGGPIVFARMMLVGSFLFMYKNYKYLFFGKRLNFIISSIFILMAILSGSKFPILIFIIINFIYYISSLKFNYNLFIFIIIFTIFISFILFYINDIINLDISSLNRIFDLFLSNDISNLSSVSARQEFIYTCFQIFYDYPIFGCGVGNWGSLANYYYNFSEAAVLYLDYPHNILLEILSETGILGFLFFLLIFYKMIFIKKDFNIFYLIFIFYFTNSLSSGDLMDFRFTFLWYFISILFNKNILIYENNSYI